MTTSPQTLLNLETLPDLLQRRATDRGCYRFLQDGREVAASLDYPALRAGSRAVANALLATVAPGSRALLLFPSGLDVLTAFFGCLEAGVIAVPVPPPEGMRLKHALPRLQAIVADAGADAIVTTAALQHDLAERMAAALPGVRWLATDTLDPAEAETGERPVLSGESLAYLQYTSGSTGSPRGVMLSHAHVLANLRYLQDGFGCDADSVSVTWMPYFHDYGLVEGLLRPLYSGTDCYVLSPLTLLKRPSRWLEAISRYGATHSHAPNFAYELCVERVTAKQRAGLDLSCWRVAGNGAEPVRADTLSRFSEIFASCGFRSDAFYPAYGLAEATLFVSARAHGTGPRALELRADALERDRVEPADPDTPEAARRLSVGCGHVQPGTDLRIVDPATATVCPVDKVGEIWVSSPSVALGYWQRPEDSRATFEARLAVEPDAGPFLRTGDLGFLRDGALPGGELHICGRLKDLIVIAGVNHYPQDIELTALSACQDLRRDHCAAFSVEREGAEQLIVLAEAGRGCDDWEATFLALRRAISERHGIGVAEIVILGRGQISKTSSGKVQRRACRQAFLEDRFHPVARWRTRAPAPVTECPPAADLEAWLAQQVADLVGTTTDRVDRNARFADLGLDSRTAVTLVGALEDRLATGPLSPTLLWRHPSIAALCDHLTGTAAETAPQAGKAAGEPIAIIGLACRLPGAADAEAFWDLLSEGRCAIRNDVRLPGVEAGFLDEADCFDADFFGLSSGEARAMDPQQRVLLEVTWTALEHAGLVPQRLEGSRTGVFIGISSADFALDQASRGDAEGLVGAYSGTGMAFSIAANRLSYQLDLRGPSLAIDTACSSSLVAVHQACQSLCAGDCGLAVAGGVNLIGGPHLQLALERAGMLSPTRRSRTFDASADGYVRGEGCAAVVLKPLAAAQRDGDRVVAVIRGSAVNQDGRSNGLTAPNPLSQQAVIGAAVAAAGLAPRDIDYVETHGTGTRLGDPIEVEALQAVLGAGRPADRPCLLGSAKANIGHLEAAAGIAGLIKAVLCLNHRAVPPQPGLCTVNPLIRLEDTPFALPTELRALPEGAPIRAAVSSFGFGGTNAHLVLEQAPIVESAPAADAVPVRSRHLLSLSARHPDALRAMAGRYAALCRSRTDLSPEILCATAALNRSQFRHRLAVASDTPEGLAEQLDDAAPHAAPMEPTSVAFLFTGQGAQYVGMSRALYDSDPGFRSDLDRCEALLSKALDRPLLSVVFGGDAALLDQTVYTQPALFSLEYALARLWQRWGVRPSILLGHSVGEYVAACLAGVFDLEAGLRLIAARARLIQSLPLDGAMLAVMADEATASERIIALQGDVSIAAVNCPRSVVLSGRRTVLETLQPVLEADGVRSRFLPVSHAFHSPLLDPILDRFHAIARGFDYAAPALPVIGNVDGAIMTAAPDADYWTRHLREPVRFADGLSTLRADHRICLEIGPKPLLSALGAQCDSAGDAVWVPTLREAQDDWIGLTEALGALYTAGVDPDWAAVHAGAARDHDLPTYPFRRERYPLPPRPQAGDAATPLRRALTDLAQSSHGAAVPVENWGYVPIWLPLSPQAGEAPLGGDWLILGDRAGTGRAVAGRLTEVGATSVPVLNDVPETLPTGAGPLSILCCWPLDLPDAEGLTADAIAVALADFNRRLTGLIQWLAALEDRPITLLLITRDAFADTTSPGDGLLQATVWGAGRALRHEYPDWRLALLDSDGSPGEAAAQILSELTIAEPCDEVRRRGATRAGLRLEPCPLPASLQPTQLGGTWLITGGFGRLGLLLAGRLVERGVRHLLLLGRNAPSAEAAARIDAWRAQGAAIQTAALDVADEPALAAALEGLPADWPVLDGIVHAAGVLDDGVLQRQSAQRVTAIMAPKVLGGWALHRLTAAHPVRHFILMSSASGLLGNPGQAAYGGANSFLDALAVHRRNRGLPATSLSWSAWSDATRNDSLADRLADLGLAPIETEQGLEAFERSLALEVPHLALLPCRRDGALAHPLIAGATAPVFPSSADARLPSLLTGLSPDARMQRVLRHVLNHVAAIRSTDPADLDPRRGFFDQGFDSMNAIELRNRLQADLGRPLAATLAFDHPTPARLARHVLTLCGFGETAPATLQADATAACDGIAIIAMGCRLPGGVRDPAGFWRLLRDGTDAISEIPIRSWDNDRFYSADPETPGTIQTRHGGFVDDIDLFDPMFFGISPREARHLDPQQRLLLEVCWETLEHGGIPPSSLHGSQTGVFIGISTNDYLHRLTGDPAAIDAYLGTGNALSVAANRLSFFLGLEGPSLAIDTACSSSLVAIHQACQSLRGGECDLAIGGGVNLLLDPTVTLNHSRARMLAPDGRCKAFAAGADGFVRSEGCGLVLLKRLSDATRDGDRVLAVIRGSAVNQDGRTSGLTVPNGPAQDRVIRRALAQADLLPDDIDYVEAHGTGTALGDPIEAGALQSVFGAGPRPRPLVIGSVKSNIGHLESAAGVAGLQKLVLSLAAAEIPASLHSGTPSPEIDWERIALRLPAGHEPWPRGDGVRRAGVSSFGFGGTNAHLVIEQAPAPAEREVPAPSRYLLPLSAKTPTALRLLARAVAEQMAETATPLADLCFTAACGRDVFTHRLAVLGQTPAEITEALGAWLAGESDARVFAGTGPPAPRQAEPTLLAAPMASPQQWEGLARRYADGAIPEWAALYAGLPLRRVDLPGHPFERERYWVEAPTGSKTPAPAAYTVRWEAVPAPAVAAAPPRGHWLILSDNGGLGAGLATELEARDQRCTLIHKAPLNGDRRNLVPGDEAAARVLLERLGPLAGVVHLWSLDETAEPTADVLSDPRGGGLASVLALTKTLHAMPVPSRLWIVTREAVRADAEDTMVGLAHAPIWGFGRSLALEPPQVWGGLLDLARTDDHKRAASMIATAFLAEDGPREAALRGERFLAPLLTPHRPNADTTTAIRADGSYLITGGFGSLGRVLGLWMARQGAGRLLLLGRKGASTPEAKAHLAAIEAHGIQVEAAALDIADAPALTAQLDKWTADGPPLRGVVHAAGLGERRDLATTHWTDCAALLSAKAAGAWALHDATREVPLDFFIGCGSVAGVWGGQRQASYCAANAFLDGLAAYRHTLGLPGACLDLGPVADSTLVDPETARALQRMGLAPVPAEALLPHLPTLLNPVEPQTVLADVDWPHFAALYRSRRATGLFDRVQPVPDTAGRPTAEPPAPPYDWLARRLGEVLGLPLDRLSPDTPLPTLGLDSLLAMELRTLIEREFGLTVELSTLLGTHSLSDLAERLMRNRTTPAGPAAPETPLIVGQL